MTNFLLPNLANKVVDEMVVTALMELSYEKFECYGIEQINSVTSHNQKLSSLHESEPRSLSGSGDVETYGARRSDASTDIEKENKNLQHTSYSNSAGDSDIYTIKSREISANKAQIKQDDQVLESRIKFKAELLIIRAMRQAFQEEIANELLYAVEKFISECPGYNYYLH